MSQRSLMLKTCPFCNRIPEVEPWHGGAATKVMVVCRARGDDCAVGPLVTGETPYEAERHWNGRQGYNSQLYPVVVDEPADPFRADGGHINLNL